MKKSLVSEALFMEAGGIEPPSRGSSAVVSTCVAVCIESRPTDAQRQASARPATRNSDPHVTSPTRTGGPAVVAPPASRRHGRDGPPIRQPCATCYRWQLIGVSGVLPGLLTTWTRGHDLNLPGRTQFAPFHPLSLYHTTPASAFVRPPGPSPARCLPGRLLTGRFQQGRLAGQRTMCQRRIYRPGPL